jgi:hypothetical protein
MSEPPAIQHIRLEIRTAIRATRSGWTEYTNIQEIVLDSVTCPHVLLLHNLDDNKTLEIRVEIVE